MNFVPKVLKDFLVFLFIVTNVIVRNVPVSQNCLLSQLLFSLKAKQLILPLKKLKAILKFLKLYGVHAQLLIANF